MSEQTTYNVGDRVQFGEDSELHLMGRSGTVTRVDAETGLVTVRHEDTEPDYDTVDPAVLEPGSLDTFDLDEPVQLIAQLRSSVADRGPYVGLNAESRMERARSASRIAFLASRVAWLLAVDEDSEQRQAKQEAASAAARARVEETTADRPPIVPVKRHTPNPDNPAAELWTIDCPYCHREHTHSGGPGHRVAHCHGDNPGYVIQRWADDAGGTR